MYAYTVKKPPLSPRLSRIITDAARPASATEISNLLEEAWIQSSEDISGGNWLEAFYTVQDSCGRVIEPKEAAILRVTIDSVLRDRENSAGEFSEKVRVVEPAPCQSTSLSTKYGESYQVGAANLVAEVINVFSNDSKMIADAKRAHRTSEDIYNMVFDSLSLSLASPRSIVAYAKHVLHFNAFLNEKKVSPAERSGVNSAFHLYEFLKEKSGTTVPATQRCALRAFGKALEIPWDLDRPFIQSVCRKPHRETKLAPILPIDVVCKFETTASDPSKPLGLRLYAANIALMVHGSLRDDDTKSVVSLSLIENAIIGEIREPNTKTPEAKKFFCTARGFETDDWSVPIFSFRRKYERHYKSPRTSYSPN